jgi:tetratricopeptide (TPR) repeat protein
VGEKLNRAETLVIAAVSFFACTGVVGMLALDAPEPLRLIEPPALSVPAAAPRDALAWFESVRQRCNPVEVETWMGWQPAPPSPDGDMYKAACFALAGKVERAREVIDGLPQQLRYVAAGVVFEAGHPAADAGDDIAAGPLMELVVEYWPNHYMALYHAGAARYDTGDYEAARRYLERFLVEYHEDDGWTGSARSMLAEISRAL